MNDMAHNYELGQVEFCDTDTWGRRPIYRTGPYGGHPRWHALRVSSQREQSAEAWLKMRGVYSFHPVRQKATFIKGIKREFQQRYLPGYVFARFPGRALIHNVAICPFITGAVTMRSGAWGILFPADLRKIHAMRNVEAAEEAERIKREQIKRGDRVRILEGLHGEGQNVEVLEIKGGKARFKIRMFGAEVDGEADVDRLDKIG